MCCQGGRGQSHFLSAFSMEGFAIYNISSSRVSDSSHLGQGAGAIVIVRHLPPSRFFPPKLCKSDFWWNHCTKGHEVPQYLQKQLGICNCTGHCFFQYIWSFQRCVHQTLPAGRTPTKLSISWHQTDCVTKVQLRSSRNMDFSLRY